MSGIDQRIELIRAIQAERVLRRFGRISTAQSDGAKMSRLGLGEFDPINFPLSYWTALRGLVRALMVEAESAFEDAVARCQPHLAATAVANEPDGQSRPSHDERQAIALYMIQHPNPRFRELGRRRMRDYLME